MYGHVVENNIILHGIPVLILTNFSNVRIEYYIALTEMLGHYRRYAHMLATSARAL